MTKIHILLLGGGKRVSLAQRFIDAGTLLNKQVKIFSYELHGDVPIQTVGTVIIGLKWSDKNIIKHLLSVLRKYRIDIVIPNVDPAIEIASRLKIQSQSFIPVSNKRECDIFYDKVKAYRWFNLNNIATPSVENTFPLIAKPVKGSASKGIIIIHNKQELDHYCAIISQFKKKYLIQQYIAGREFSVDAYITQNKKIMAMVPRERLEVVNGEVVRSVTVKNNTIVSIAKKVLNKSNVTGPVNMQFIKEERSDIIYIIELNARFGGGVILSLEAGANMCLMLLQEYLHIQIKESNNWKTNIMMLRSWREDFICK